MSLFLKDQATHDLPSCLSRSLRPTFLDKLLDDEPSLSFSGIIAEVERCKGTRDYYKQVERHLKPEAPDILYCQFEPFGRELYALAGRPPENQRRILPPAQHCRWQNQIAALPLMLWQKVIGRRDMPANTAELLDALRSELSGQKAFEIGPGNGDDLHLLRFLGMEAWGIERQRSESNCGPSKEFIVYGDAPARLRAQPSKSVRLIYSSNVFCDGVIEVRDAYQIAMCAPEVLVQGGVALHQLHYEELRPAAAFWSYLTRHAEESFARSGSIDRGKMINLAEFALKTTKRALQPCPKANKPVLDTFDFEQDGMEVETVTQNSILSFVCKKVSA